MRLKIIFLFVCTIHSLPLLSQNLAGKFIAQNSIWSGELSLMRNGHFKMSSSLNMGHVVTLSRGYHFEIKDTLILVFEKYTDPNPSRCIVITDKNDGKSGIRLISGIQVHDKEGKPLPGIMITLKGKDKEEFVTLFADSNGEVGSIVLPSNYVGVIHFQMMGYKQLVLDVNSIDPTTFSLEVILQPFEGIEYDETVRIGKYLIRSNKTSIELHRVGPEREIIYLMKR